MSVKQRRNVEELEPPSSELLYGLEDNPPWYLCVLLGTQHFFTMVSTTIPIPFVLASLVCLEPSDPARSYLVSTIIFVSGLITFLQSTIGVRLPIVQGGNFAYLIPTVALLSANFASCESQRAANLTAAQQQEEWQARMRAIQGNIAVSSVFQIILGFTGVIGVMLKWITPLTIIPTVSLVGLSLFDLAADRSSQHWSVSMSTTVLMVLLSQYMKDVSLSLPTGYRRGYGFIYSEVQVFKMFSIIVALLTSWLVCWVLTVTDTFPPGCPSRTDRSTLISNTPWFRIPYPGQWGMPTVTVAGVLGMMVAGLASIIESVGDYYATARICGTPAPPVHAINRGVGIEGVGVTVAGLWGSGSGTNSYSENLAAITVTRVGSRRVIQMSAMVMLVAGSVCKFGALCASIPEPIVASLYWIMFSLITSVGLSTLQFVDLNSSRNLFVLGFTLFFSLSVSKYVKANPESLKTGLPLLDQTLLVLLQTTIFLGCVLGCFLDNTIPGTKEERGLVSWRAQQGDSKSCPGYDLPYGMDAIRRRKWLRYLPFSPTFRGFHSAKYNVTVNTTTSTPVPVTTTTSTPVPVTTTTSTPVAETTTSAAII
ncbi:solute carrier family 23 member 1 [Cherax quadricarinatus]